MISIFQFFVAALWRYLAYVLVGIIVLLSAIMTWQHFTIAGLELIVSGYEDNLKDCQNKVDVLNSLSNQTFNGSEFDRRYEQDLRESCRKLLERSGRELTEDDIRSSW